MKKHSIRAVLVAILVLQAMLGQAEAQLFSQQEREKYGVMDGSRRDIFGKNKGYVLRDAQRQQGILNEQNQKLGTLVDKQQELVQSVQKMGSDVVGQQAKTNEILDRLTRLEEERVQREAEQASLKEALKEAMEEKEAEQLNQLSTSAGGNSGYFADVEKGRIVARNNDGSVTFRVRE